MASSSALAEYIASLHTQTCEGGFLAVGIQPGEAPGTLIRVLSTLITVSITSAWFNYRKITRLLLFFSHWLRYV